MALHHRIIKNFLMVTIQNRSYFFATPQLHLILQFLLYSNASEHFGTSSIHFLNDENSVIKFIYSLFVNFTHDVAVEL